MRAGDGSGSEGIMFLKEVAYAGMNAMQGRVRGSGRSVSVVVEEYGAAKQQE